MLHVPGLYIHQGPNKGRGVYCAEKLKMGDLIEICPVIKIGKNQLHLIDQTSLHDYYFLWEEAGFEACIALGYGSLYNHHPSPNAEVVMDYKESAIRIISLMDIQPGTEILIDYTGGTRGMIKLWFEVDKGT